MLFTLFFFFNLYILEIGEEQTKKKQKWEIKLIIKSINTKNNNYKYYTTKYTNLQISKYWSIIYFGHGRLKQ